MKITVTYQESYSRGELLLRTFFGFAYIAIPHTFLMLFAQLWSSIITFLSFWIILFTGKYPQSFWEFNLGFMKWSLRVNAVLYNLVDAYPAFWVNENNNNEISNIEIDYPESSNRVSVLLRTIFGIFYVILPHMVVLYFRLIATSILSFLAWWSVLFTGNYPKDWHEFNVGTLRWSTRLSMYMLYLTDEYPPFTGKNINSNEPVNPTTAQGDITTANE